MNRRDLIKGLFFCILSRIPDFKYIEEDDFKVVDLVTTYERSIRLFRLRKDELLKCHFVGLDVNGRFIKLPRAFCVDVDTDKALSITWNIYQNNIPKPMTLKEVLLIDPDGYHIRTFKSRFFEELQAGDEFSLNIKFYLQ